MADRAYYASVQAVKNQEIESVVLTRSVRRTAVPAVRGRGPHRAAQRIPAHRAGDRPDRRTRVSLQHVVLTVGPDRQLVGYRSLARGMASGSTGRTFARGRQYRCATATVSTWGAWAVITITCGCPGTGLCK